MKFHPFLLIGAMLMMIVNVTFGQIGINTDGNAPDPSALLDVKSTEKGLLIPRMNNLQRDSIINPANGLMIFCTNCGLEGSLSLYSNGTWKTFAPCNSSAPLAAVNSVSPGQIIWAWNSVAGAYGYKWNTTDNYNSAIDMGTELSKTEGGLICDSLYSRYVWSYNTCSFSAVTLLTEEIPITAPSAPAPASHVPSPDQIAWMWNAVSGANGYKWNTTDNYGNAVDLGGSLSYTENGLLCNTSYTRYLWAYNNCEVCSSVTILAQMTTSGAPDSPVEGTHAATSVQITWNWNPVEGASGYKWNTVNNFEVAEDLLQATSRAESGLTCNTSYTRYVWAYNNCANSVSTPLSQSTSMLPPATPTSGVHENDYTQIIWHWNTVTDATGYKWSTTNNYANATDMGTNTAYTETGLTCGTSYTRYVWAYNSCGQSTALTTSKSTVACFVCGNTISKTHVAGDVAPVNKTVSYGTVTNVPGETSKCWITSNLGADHQATAVTDATEASAGWYWQFNHKQGYKHDGINRTPNSTWLSYFAEYADWTSANDPCTLELGNGWRMPTKLEWDHVDATGGWTTWNGPWTSLLKLHAAGRLNSTDGTLANRGLNGIYWGSTQSGEEMGWRLNFNSGACSVSAIGKPYGFNVRCIKD